VSVVLHTLRPSGYPRGDLPAHIHVETEGLVTEILFEDDPRLTPVVRERGIANGFQVGSPIAGSDGVTRYEVSFTLRRRAKGEPSARVRLVARLR
jgi:protocatechuate 3,4-dioxygenase beta subunit